MLNDPIPWNVRVGRLDVIVPDLKAALTVATASSKGGKVGICMLSSSVVVIEGKQIDRLLDRA